MIINKEYINRLIDTIYHDSVKIKKDRISLFDITSLESNSLKLLFFKSFINSLRDRGFIQDREYFNCIKSAKKLNLSSSKTDFQWLYIDYIEVEGKIQFDSLHFSNLKFQDDISFKIQKDKFINQSMLDVYTLLDLEY